MKKIIALTLAVVMLFGNNVFAQENTTEVTGNIQASIINVDIPTSASFLIDPNGPSFISPELTISNNSTMPVTVFLSSFDNKADTPNQFVEVGKFDKDWYNLGTFYSQRYIYLALDAVDSTDDGYVDGDQWEWAVSAAEVQLNDFPTWCASIRANQEVVLDMESEFGHAFSGSFITTYELVFIVSVMD